MTVKFDISAPYDVEEADVAFARPQGMELLARVYRAKGQATGPLPAVVDVHGGAWTRLDRTTGAILGRGLAACGVVVVALDFRMGPDHKHPAASADVAAGLRWVRAHAGRLGVDPTRVGHRRQLERRPPRLAPRRHAQGDLSRRHADHHARRLARRHPRRSRRGLRDGGVPGLRSPRPVPLRALPQGRAAAALRLQRPAAHRRAQWLLSR